MEIHQLRYFVAVANLRSFTRAARQCLVAQPSLSQQIIKLERELRQPLFDRLGRSIRLTAAGQTLHAHAVAILAAIDGIPDRVKAVADPHQGKIQVGAIPTIAPYLLPPVLKEFSKRFPRATVMVNENLTDHVVRGCLEGELDVGIIASPVASEFFGSEVLFSEELLLALPPKHPFVNKRTITWSDLAGQPFVLMNELHCLGEQAMGFCKQNGCLPTIICQSVQLLTIQKLVALGQGLSLIPAMACHEQQGRRCIYRRLAAPSPSRSVHILWRKDRFQSPILSEFAQALRNVGAP